MLDTGAAHSPAILVQDTAEQAPAAPVLQSNKHPWKPSTRLKPRSVTSSETHQSLLVLERPVFGLVLHHCGNILIKDPHKKEIRDSQESPANQSAEEEEEDCVLPPAISCAESNRFLYRKTSCMVQSEVGAPDREPRPAVASQQRWWGWTAYTASLLHSHCAAAAVCLSLDLLDLRMFAFYSVLFFRALVRGRRVACGSAEIVSDKQWCVVFFFSFSCAIVMDDPALLCSWFESSLDWSSVMSNVVGLALWLNECHKEVLSGRGVVTKKVISGVLLFFVVVVGLFFNV